MSEHGESGQGRRHAGRDARRRRRADLVQNSPYWMRDGCSTDPADRAPARKLAASSVCCQSRVGVVKVVFLRLCLTPWARRTCSYTLNVSCASFQTPRTRRPGQKASGAPQTSTNQSPGHRSPRGAGAPAVPSPPPPAVHSRHVVAAPAASSHVHSHRDGHPAARPHAGAPPPARQSVGWP